MHDQTIVGWLVTISYSGLLLQPSLRHRGSAPRHATVPRGCSSALPQQCSAQISNWICKATLQSSAGRWRGRMAGTVNEGRCQAAFVCLIGLCGAALLATLIWQARARARSVKLALFGLVVLSVFVMIRIVSIHHVDRLMRFELAGTRLTLLLELGEQCLSSRRGLAFLRQSRTN
jgi:hypothetical protein